MSKKSTSVTQAPALIAGQKIFLILTALVPLVYSSSLYDFSLLPKRLLIQTALLILGSLWVLDLTSGRSLWRPSKLYLPCSLYLIWNVASVTQGTSPISSLVTLGHEVTCIALFLLVYHLFPLNALPQFLRISAGIGILISILGIAEARGIDAWWLPLSNGRPSATFAYRNFAAAYLIMNLPLSILLGYRSKNLKDVSLGIISTALMLIFLIYTRSRGAWIGFSCAISITVLIGWIAHYRWQTPLAPTLLRTNKTAQSIALLASILVIGFAIVPPKITSQQSRAIDDNKVTLRDAISSITTPTGDRGRKALWLNTLDMVADHPILGVGLGNWRYAYPPYDKGAMIRADSDPQNPHNGFLKKAAETGIPGLLAYLWILLTLGQLTIHMIRHSEQAAYGLAFVAGMLAMLGHSMVSFPQELAETSWLFWFGLGIIASLTNTKIKREPTFKSSRITYLLPIMLFLCLWTTYRQIQFDQHYLRALEYNKGNDLNGVLTEASRALQWGPFDAQAFFLQGNGYQAQGLFPRAESAYQSGLSIAPYSVQLLGAMGTLHAIQNHFDLAEKHYQDVLNIYPEYYQMYNNLGGVYQNRGDLKQAIIAYQKALSYNQAYIDAWSNLGLVYVAADSTAQAIATYQKALTLFPDDAALYYGLGEAYDHHATKDATVLPQAIMAYEIFIKKWRGAPSETLPAQKRIENMRKQLAGSSP